MRIELIDITLRNWRGAENLVVKFNGQGETVISGTNGTFKSTVSEAYRWAITGKDTLDRKDYDLKNTVKKNLNRLDHEVIINMLVDGQKKELRRVFREVWQRPRGQEQDVYKGNETLFFINDVPFNAGQYAEVLKGWFSDVQFKILTDPLFFNTPNGDKWKWNNMRDILVGIAGPIDREEVFEAAEVYGDRRESLNESIKTWGSLDKLKKEVNEKIKKAKDELKGIPESIESQERTKPELLKWSDIETGIEALKQALEQVNSEIHNASKGDEALEMQKQEKRKEIREIEFRMNNRKAEISEDFKQKNRERTDKIATKEQELRDAERTILSRQRDVEDLEKSISRYESEKTRLLGIYNEKTAETAPEMDSSLSVCPTCDRSYDPDKIDNARKLFTSNWNARHAEAIETIKNEGSAIKRKIADATSALFNEKAKVIEAEESKAKIEKEFAEARQIREYKQSDLDEVLKEDGSFNEAHSDFLVANGQLVELEESGKADEQREAVLEKLKGEKNSYSLELLKLQNQLATKSQYERVVAEIERLKEKQTAAGSVIAELEGIEFAIEGYNKARNQVVETRVNRMFPEHIKFKLFDTQVSGETTEWCELYSNEMPWGTLNTGGKINAGLACIDVFQSFWNLYLPVWIDNRESTVSIPEMLSQVVNLIVDPSKEKLTVS